MSRKLSGGRKITGGKLGGKLGLVGGRGFFKNNIYEIGERFAKEYPNILKGQDYDLDLFDQLVDANFNKNASVYKEDREYYRRQERQLKIEIARREIEIQRLIKISKNLMSRAASAPTATRSRLLSQKSLSRLYGGSFIYGGSGALFNLHGIKLGAARTDTDYELENYYDNARKLYSFLTDPYYRTPFEIKHYEEGLMPKENESELHYIDRIREFLDYANLGYTPTYGNVIPAEGFRDYFQAYDVTIEAMARMIWEEYTLDEFQKKLTEIDPLLQLHRERERQKIQYGIFTKYRSNPLDFPEILEERIRNKGIK